MNLVQVRGTQIIYRIETFERLTIHEADKVRDNLICTGCGEQAYYRRRSKDGKSACFGAAHKDGCTMASMEAEEESPIKGRAQALEEATAGDVPLFLKSGIGEPDPTDVVLSLEDALLLLATSKRFRYSKQALRVGNLENWTPERFFINVANAENVMSGTFRGYYGQITGYRYVNPSTLWINSRQRGEFNKEVSILISSADMLRKIQEANGIGEKDDWLGRHFLLLGRIERAQKTNKPFIRVKHPLSWCSTF